MTTAQLTHLRAIDAHLAKLLNIAAKRTPGEWYSVIPTGDTPRKDSWLEISNDEKLNRGTESDEEFIASCAGNAEAGWRLIRQEIEDWFLVFDTTNHEHLDYPALNRILDAFPLESLKP